MAAWGVATLGALAWIGACSPSTDELLTDAKYGTTGAGGTGGHGGSTTTTTGTGGKPPVECKGDPSMDPTLVVDQCGVFVRADAATEGNGDMDTPYKTLQAAIDKAALAGKWVFACNAGELKENVAITKPVAVYGGFDCSSSTEWVWAKDTKTKLTGAPNTIILSIATTASDVSLHDLAITAPPSAAAMIGGSSIAVIIDSATATLERCDITAGDAVDGAAGDDASSSPPPTPSKTAMNDGKNACAALGGDQATGGSEQTNDCGGNVSSVGGLGGGSTKSGGLPGIAGDATPPPANPAGKGGLADTACASGGSGGEGADGDPGEPGIAGTGIGAIDGTLGWSGLAAKAGEPGKPGQGGGGGGGKKGGNAVCSGGPGAGPTGGSGGAGGCGGLAGGGGRPGGSSIALVSINTNKSVISLIDCKLKAGKGGAGGRGGNAQPGGSGEAGGTGGLGAPAGLTDACNGGKGGAGGAGGPGGGGPGGHSLAIAYSGDKPVLAKSTLTPGMPGAAGPGGVVGNTTGPSGDPGKAPADGTLVFP
ncbi:MAG: hypothetical protein U0359_40020 [Byssovorax sp.]